MDGNSLCVLGLAMISKTRVKVIMWSLVLKCHFCFRTPMGIVIYFSAWYLGRYPCNNKVTTMLFTLIHMALKGHHDCSCIGLQNYRRAMKIQMFKSAGLYNIDLPITSTIMWNAITITKIVTDMSQTQVYGREKALVPTPIESNVHP